MARIAVYSRNTHGMELILDCIAESEKQRGWRNDIVCYDSEASLVWDVESVGMFDLVVVYRDWEAAEMFRPIPC